MAGILYVSVLSVPLKFVMNTYKHDLGLVQMDVITTGETFFFKFFFKFFLPLHRTAIVSCPHCHFLDRHRLSKVEGWYFCEDEEECFVSPPLNKWHWSIPAEYQGCQEMFYVGNSNIKGANLGLFAARKLKPPICLLYGGYLVNSDMSGHSAFDLSYIIHWQEYSPLGVRGIPFDPLTGKGFLAPLANEPKYWDKKSGERLNSKLHKANCIFDSNANGIYLILCKEINQGDELFVWYGTTYGKKTYKRPTEIAQVPNTDIENARKILKLSLSD